MGGAQSGAGTAAGKAAQAKDMKAFDALIQGPNGIYFSFIEPHSGDTGGNWKEVSAFIRSFVKLGSKPYLQDKAMKAIIPAIWCSGRYMDEGTVKLLKPFFEIIGSISLSTVFKLGDESGCTDLVQRDGFNRWGVAPRDKRGAKISSSDTSYGEALHLANEDAMNELGG